MLPKNCPVYPRCHGLVLTAAQAGKCLPQAVKQASYAIAGILWQVDGTGMFF